MSKARKYKNFIDAQYKALIPEIFIHSLPVSNYMPSKPTFIQNLKKKNY
jgi:hypothetical protein